MGPRQVSREVHRWADEKDGPVLTSHKRHCPVSTHLQLGECLPVTGYACSLLYCGLWFPATHTAPQSRGVSCEPRLERPGSTSNIPVLF